MTDHTEEEIRNLTRDVLLDRIKRGASAHSHVAIDEEEATVVAEALFTDEVSEAGSDAIWYSDTFEGAPDYLRNSGRPDLDISPLMWKPEDWPEADRPHIPALDPNYIWQHEALYAVVQGQLLDMKSMLVGDTGTGKSKLHENLAAVYNQPFYRLNGRGDMESDTILGRVDLENGSTTFLLGEFTKRFVAGYYILLDEPWKLPASINMALQRPLERDGILQIDDMKGDLIDKQFAPHKRTILTLADNVVGTGDDDGRFAATMLQDSSTLNRIDLVIHLDYLSPGDETGMLTRRFPAVPTKQAGRAVQMANMIRQGCREGQLSVTMSPRNLMAWMELATKARSYEHGFIYTMLNRFADHNERDTVVNFWSTVYGSPLV
jgi:cobaltochelatase CobS